MDSLEINTWEEFSIMRLLLLHNHIFLVEEEEWGNYPESKPSSKRVASISLVRNANLGRDQIMPPEEMI